jgi:hypothetical protein
MGAARKAVGVTSEPHPEDALAAILADTYGGQAIVVLGDDLRIGIHPANGGSIHAWLADANSPVLAALLGVYRTQGKADTADPSK